jgi:hypothetical protein
MPDPMALMDPVVFYRARTSRSITGLLVKRSYRISARVTLSETRTGPSIKRRRMLIIATSSAAKKKTIKGSAGEVVQGEACESPLSERIDEQRLRKLRAEAKAKEALVDQIYGTLIPLDTVKELWLERHLIVRSGLLSIVDRMPALLAGRNQKEIEKLLRDEVVSILNGFGKDGNFTPKSE